ncbi:hypothetical protein E2P81_ATG03850 [Venturia nashicola]|uniref:Uncharacterized protein n=1 Tax=Venturia nashicola TaxID=86259 RepID=A0A4Z1PEY3_9PEZI|nr:hypothetical protein E6O75_ATG03942 [Venturia nashicola]TLD38175.1 hypothetical protein E2P81_ATG03850 [Venturia nashicola]
MNFVCHYDCSNEAFAIWGCAHLLPFPTPFSRKPPQPHHQPQSHSPTRKQYQTMHSLSFKLSIASNLSLPSTPPNQHQSSLLDTANSPKSQRPQTLLKPLSHPSTSKMSLKSVLESTLIVLPSCCIHCFIKQPVITVQRPRRDTLELADYHASLTKDGN